MSEKARVYGLRLPAGTPRALVAHIRQLCCTNGGTIHFSDRGREAMPAETSLIYKPARRNGMYLASAVVTGRSRHGGNLALHELAASAGYHAQRARLGAELGPRIGLGKSFALHAQGGLDFSLAAELALMVRVCGTADLQTGYIPVGFGLDAVAFGRAGAWAQGGGPVNHPDPLFVVGLALRLSIVSSLTDDDSRRWERP